MGDLRTALQRSILLHRARKTLLNTTEDTNCLSGNEGDLDDKIRV